MLKQFLMPLTFLVAATAAHASSSWDSVRAGSLVLQLHPAAVWVVDGQVGSTSVIVKQPGITRIFPRDELAAPLETLTRQGFVLDEPVFYRKDYAESRSNTYRGTVAKFFPNNYAALKTEAGDYLPVLLSELRKYVFSLGKFRTEQEVYFHTPIAVDGLDGLVDRGTIVNLFLDGGAEVGVGPNRSLLVVFLTTKNLALSSAEVDESALIRRVIPTAIR